MGFQKFGNGELLGQDVDDFQGISTTAAAEQPWTESDAAELERESTTGTPAESAREE